MSIQIGRQYYAEQSRIKTELSSLWLGASQENPEISRETINEEGFELTSMTKCYHSRCCLIGLPINTIVKRVYTDRNGEPVKIETFGFHEPCLNALLDDKKIPHSN